MKRFVLNKLAEDDLHQIKNYLGYGRGRQRATEVRLRQIPLPPSA